MNAHKLISAGLAFALVAAGPHVAVAGSSPAAPGQHSFVPAWILGGPAPQSGGQQGTQGAAGAGSAQGAQGAQAPQTAQNAQTTDQQIEPGAAISAQATAIVVNALNVAAAFCGAVEDDQYVIDCLASEYRDVERLMPDTGDYAEAKAAIAEAATRLEALARANRSPTRRPARLTQGGAAPHQSSRPVIPVRAEALPALAEDAARIIEETQTILLRSAETSARRRIPYQSIARAMDSGTILLRAL